MLWLTPRTPGRNARHLFTLGSLLALAACGSVTDAEAPRAPLSPVTTPSADGAAEAQARQLARGLAAALVRPELRAQLRNAMRESHWNEQKLVLQAFARTRAGEELVAAAAPSLGTTPQALQQAIAALPELDFYLPFAAHRGSWRGSPDILVGATFHGNAPTLETYGTDGARRTLRLADGVPAQPLLLLQPAEPKQATDGSGVGGTVQLVECGTDCGGGGGGGGGTSTPPAPGVYVTHFNIQEGDGWFGSLEIQFHSQAVSGVYPPYSPINGSGYWIFDDYCSKGNFNPSFSPDEDRGYDGLWMLSPGITNVYSVACSQPRSYMYAIHIVEIDGGLNGANDDFGYRFFNAGGATVGTVLEFRRPEDNARTAWVKVEYRY